MDSRSSRLTGEYLKAIRILAEQGNGKAQHNLGAMYLNGQGVEHDPVQAAHWFRLAALQGIALSQHNLGVLFLKGVGVVRDPQEAVRWFRLAAEQGDARAQHSLGAAYFEGLGVEKEWVQAYVWLSLARNGMPEDIQPQAQAVHDYVESQLSTDQRKRAQQLLAAQPRPPCPH